MEAQMKRTWLIQRLSKPYKHDKENPLHVIGQAFSGGKDLTKDAYDVLSQIFRFDYMGSAEFEFGAVPESLKEILSRSKKGINTVGKVEHKGYTLYYICGVSQVNEVANRLKEWLKKEPPCKERTELHRALGYPDDIEFYKKSGFYKTEEEQKGDTRGWLELDNHFFFFCDEVMFAKTALMFGVEQDLVGYGEVELKD